MRALGWFFVLGGFVWIVFAEVSNTVLEKHGWSDEMARYTPDRSYSRDEVHKAMFSVSSAISRLRTGASWGGISMLFGAFLLDAARGRRRFVTQGGLSS